MLLGHEAAGIVEQLGEGVTDVAPGDRVVMTFLPRCGACAGCRHRWPTALRGRHRGQQRGDPRRRRHPAHRRLRIAATQDVHHHLGVSAFASHAVVSRTSVVPVDATCRPRSPRCSAARCSPAAGPSSTRVVRRRAPRSSWWDSAESAWPRSSWRSRSVTTVIGVDAVPAQAHAGARTRRRGGAEPGRCGRARHPCPSRDRGGGLRAPSRPRSTSPRPATRAEAATCGRALPTAASADRAPSDHDRLRASREITEGRRRRRIRADRRWRFSICQWACGRSLRCESRRSN